MIAVLAFGGLFTASDSAAQSGDGEVQAETRPELVVGVREAPPFSLRDGDDWRGLSIRAWEDVAARNDWTYRYVPAGLDAVLAGTGTGRFDVGLGAFTVTAERERTLDFSHPFYTSGLGLAVRSAPESGWWTVLSRFLSLEFLTVAASLGGLLLIFGVLVWLFERRVNPEEFDARVGPGIGAGFWWAAVTMTTVGYGDKSPRSLGGRVVALIWMFAAIIVISGFTAAITTSLTVSRLGSSIESVDDLEGRRIATLAGSASAEWLADNGFRTVEFASLDEALQAVDAEQVPAVLYDAPLLIDRIGAMEESSLRVLPERVERLDYAFVLPEGSPLREPINRALLETTRSPGWQRALDRYLPQR
ncbi:transporter substrate-binding domain-containing protein [Halomonas denitrificans]|nr:transporter substrate-binding domain-containing protein [Halomonas denitrificans]